MSVAAVAILDDDRLPPARLRILGFCQFTESACWIKSGPCCGAEVLSRYRHFREISRQHHSAVLDFLSKDTIISQARRLGLAQGKTLLLDSMDDLNLAFDLAIHTAPQDRTRAIDRYARAARLAPESDE